MRNYKKSLIITRNKTPSSNANKSQEGWSLELDKVCSSKKMEIDFVSLPKGIYINKYNRHLFKRYSINLNYFNKRRVKKPVFLDIEGYKLFIRNAIEKKITLDIPVKGTRRHQLSSLLNKALNINKNILKMELVSNIFFSCVELPYLGCLRRLGSGYYQITAPPSDLLLIQLIKLFNRFPSSVTIGFANKVLKTCFSLNRRNFNFATNIMWAFYRKIMSNKYTSLFEGSHLKRFDQLLMVFIELELVLPI